MEKQTIKDLVQKALETMMPDQLICAVNETVEPGAAVLGTASDTTKILCLLRDQKVDECKVFCGKRRSPEEEETHFDLHIIIEVLNDLFWSEVSFWAGQKNDQNFNGYGVRDEWKIIGSVEDNETLPAIEKISGVSLFNFLIEKVSEKMQNIPEKIKAGGELQESQTDLGEMTDYEKALALVHFEAINAHTLLLEENPKNLPQLFEKKFLVETSSLLFKQEIRLRLGLKAKHFNNVSFLDNWHVAGGEISEEDAAMMAMMIGSSPFGMAVAMAAMMRVFDED